MNKLVETWRNVALETGDDVLMMAVEELGEEIHTLEHKLAMMEAMYIASSKASNALVGTVLDVLEK